ncbi:MAG TPA: glycosyltransferase family 1 protein [Microbacteriaceae bacterium]|nr:glycosyltransferase family 1 protein [Microbacteriaceae bacterium]
MKLQLLLKKARTAVRHFRKYGLASTAALVARRFRFLTGKAEIASLVDFDDVAAADWTRTPPWRADALAVDIQSRPMRVAWIMSPPGAESGGHQNIFRFIRVLEDHGHECTVFLYNVNGNMPNESSVKQMMARSEAYPDVAARILPYASTTGIGDGFDAVFATGWETAYPSYNDASRARRFYFIQDFEPMFYPVGSDSILAENTYRFGFHGITAGAWLAHTLRRDYGMETAHFDFAVDPATYSLTNTDARSAIFFYARPVTPRRAFELGVTVLTDFHRLMPDIDIHFAGWNTKDWKVPFPYVNHGSLQLSALNDLYNRCAGALVLSLSNLSLLPLELAAAGVRPVVNDGPNNRMVSDHPYISYVPPSPHAMAEALAETVRHPLTATELRAMSDSVRNFTWADSGTQFMRAFEEAMRG